MKAKTKQHSPLLIGEIDRVLLVVVFNLFVQFARLCGQLSDLTPNSNSNRVLEIATSLLLFLWFCDTFTQTFLRVP